MRVAIAAMAVSLLGVTSVAPAQQERVLREDRIYYVPVGDSVARGPDDALVTIVEFSDFRCGACRHAQRTMQQILSLYPGEIRFVYKHFVIFGDRSLLASLASMAAGAQGQFWAMHDRIFSADAEIETAVLDGFARDLGLDMGRWRADTEAKQAPFVDTLLQEMTLAETLSLNGTPTFFVNGRPMPFTGETADFVRAIDDEMRRAKQALDAGAPRDKLYEHLIANGRHEADVAFPVGLGHNGLARGKDDALVTMVLFEDFQCGYCGKLSKTIAELESEFGDDLRIVFRHLPLGHHDDAALAHEAAQEAATQGKFWEFHDLLYANQRDLGRKALEKYARSIGLKMKKFRRALDDSHHAVAVVADLEAGRALGIQGTPTIFINGEKIVGAQPIAVFRAVIEVKLAEANELLEREDVPRSKVYETIVGARD